MSLLSESLLAVTGVIRPKPDDTSVGRADELLEQLKARARRWLGSSTVKPWTPPPSQGFATAEALRERLLYTPGEPEGVEHLGDAVLAAEWVLELKDAREQLCAAWPGMAMRGGLAEEEPPLSLDRTQDWLGLVAVVEDPTRLLHELEAGAVLPAQVAIFKSVYPDIMRQLVGDLFKALVDLQLKNRDLTPAKERSLRLVLGTPPEEPILVAKPEEPPPGKPKQSSEAQDTRTVAQKAGT